MDRQVFEEKESPHRMVNELNERILEECVRMTRYALNSGMQVEPSIIEAIENFTNRPTSSSTTSLLGQKLITAHNQLSRLIAPAKPNTLPEARQYYRKIWIFPRIPKLNLVGQLIGLPLFFLLVFIVSSLPEDINADTIAKDFTELHGTLLFIYLSMLLSIAGLGASFAALFQANRFIKNHTFDPSQTSTYYVQILLGIVAGLFISQLLDVDTSGETLHLLSKPTLALLGGFSSTVVYRILKQLLAALESLVKGDSEDIIATQRQLLQIDAQQMIQESRLKVTTELLPLRSQLPEQLQTKFDEKIAFLLGVSIPILNELEEPAKN